MHRFLCQESHQGSISPLEHRSRKRKYCATFRVEVHSGVRGSRKAARWSPLHYNFHEIRACWESKCPKFRKKFQGYWEEALKPLELLWPERRRTTVSEDVCDFASLKFRHAALYLVPTSVRRTSRAIFRGSFFPLRYFSRTSQALFSSKEVRGKLRKVGRRPQAGKPATSQEMGRAASHNAA